MTFAMVNPLLYATSGRVSTLNIGHRAARQENLGLVELPLLAPSNEAHIRQNGPSDDERNVHHQIRAAEWCHCSHAHEAHYGISEEQDNNDYRHHKAGQA